MFEKLSKLNKLERAKALWKEAASKDRGWQAEARSDFDFRDGNQWSKEERAILEEELRPVLTFNLTKSSIDLIMGMSEDNKILHRAVPIDPSDGFLAEVLNDVNDWMRDTNDFDDEESAALESAAICGRGFVGIDFIPDPKRFGEIIMQQIAIPVSEIHFDPAARRVNLDDASFICWDRWLTKEDFMMRFPKMTRKKMDDLIETMTDSPISATDAVQSPMATEPHYGDDESDYNTPLDFQFYDKTHNQIRVIHMEYWENFDRQFMYNPETNKFEELPQNIKLSEAKKQFEKEFGQEAVIETLRDKKVKWIQFTGDEILYDDDSPLPYSGFSIVPLFAFRDISQKTANHFGLVRLMRDPQKEVNKRWSQTLNLLNQQVQPGIYAETNTFVNDRQAEQSLKEAGSITWVNSGAITGGRIKERTVPQFPNAPMQMEQYSQDIMKKITGINPDLLGQDRGRQEPGVVVRMRQQQGMTLLKPLFKSFNTMKKQLFKRQLAIIMAYMPDDQILRILGQTDRYQVDKATGQILDTMTELVADVRAVRELDYNIAGEEAPGNMTKRMMELSAFMEMQQQGLPVPPDMIIEKMDIAASDKQKWMQYINESQQSLAQEQEQMMAAQMALQEKELSLEEQRIMNDFILGLAKIKQMTEKDAQKMQMTAAQLSATEQRDMLNYIQSLANIARQARADDMQAETERGVSTQSNGARLIQQMMQASTSIQQAKIQGSQKKNEQRKRT